MNRVLFLFLTRSMAICCTIALLANLPSGLLAQSPPATHSRVTLDNGTADTADDMLIFPFVGTVTGTGFQGGDSSASSLFLQHTAPTGSMSFGTNGVGIGLSGFESTAAFNAQAPLHVVGGGPGSTFQTSPAFPNAQVIIEDRNDETAPATTRGMLNMRSNGGIAMGMIDLSTGGSNYAIVNDFGRFALFNNTTPGVSFRHS